MLVASLSPRLSFFPVPFARTRLFAASLGLRSVLHNRGESYVQSNLVIASCFCNSSRTVPSLIVFNFNSLLTVQTIFHRKKSDEMKIRKERKSNLCISGCFFNKAGQSSRGV